MSFKSRYQPSDVQENLDEIPVFVKRMIVDYIDRILPTLFAIGVENMEDSLSMEIDDIDNQYYIIIHYITSYNLTYELEPLTLQQLLKLHQRNLPLGAGMMRNSKKDVLFI